MRCVAKRPLNRTEPADIGRPVDLWRHVVESRHKAIRFRRDRWIRMEKQRKSLASHLMPPLQDGQPSVRLSGTDLKLDSVLGTPFSHLLRDPRTVLIHG